MTCLKYKNYQEVRGNYYNLLFMKLINQFIFLNFELFMLQGEPGIYFNETMFEGLSGAPGLPGLPGGKGEKGEPGILGEKGNFDFTFVMVRCNLHFLFIYLR